MRVDLFSLQQGAFLRDKARCEQKITKIPRVGFWQNGFFAYFCFWAAGFFHGFSRRIFSPRFCGEKKCPEKSSRKIPGKILQKLCNKNPRHISTEGPGQKSFLSKTKLWECRQIFMTSGVECVEKQGEQIHPHIKSQFQVSNWDSYRKQELYHWGQNYYIPFFRFGELFSVVITGNFTAWYSLGN